MVAVLPAQVQPGVIQLNDTGDDAINADCHEQGDGAQHRDLFAERRAGYGAERNHDNLGGQDKIRADGTLNFLFLDGDHIDGWVNQRLQMFFVMDFFRRVMEKLVGELFAALVTEVCPANHQQRRDRPRD